MAFKASKKRQRKAPEPVGRGTPIHPSAAIEKWYAKKLLVIVGEMMKDYREEIQKGLDKPSVEKFFAQDAAADSVFKTILRSLNQRWGSIFEAFAAKLAPEFVDKAEKGATAATVHSLKVAGVKAPVATYNEYVRSTLGAYKDFNHTLITSIQQEAHEKIHTAVMLSITSPNPEEQGQSGIINALRKTGEFSENRAKLIAEDQTSKVYSSLSDDRMRENGVEEFEWMHSSAGKYPRHTHVEKNGQTFKINDPKLWTGPKADQGPPGWAIKCRCRAIPIIR